MVRRLLDDKFEWPGFWFLPSNPTHRVPGTLKFEDRRSSLHLQQSLAPRTTGAFAVTDAPVEHAVVHGASVSGEPITLLRAMQVRSSFNFGLAGATQPETLSSNWLVVGEFIEQDQSFSSATFRVPGLAPWLEQRQISEDSTHTAGLSRYQFSAPHPYPTDRSAVPAIDADIEWGVGVTVKRTFAEASLHSQGWFRITPKSPQPLNWFVNEQSRLVTLLTLLSGVPMPVDSMRIDTGQPRDVWVLPSIQHFDACVLKEPHEFFVRRGQIDLNKATSLWFESAKKLDVVSELALSVIASKRLSPLDIRFQALAQALEGFHRALYPGNYMSESDYQEVRESLGKAIPSKVVGGHRDSLKSRIKFGYQFSLRKRLSDLNERLGPELSQVIVGDPKNMGRWVDTRNYYAHWDAELLPSRLGGQELYFACERMEHFLRALMILEMGIPSSTLLESYKNSSRLSQGLVQLNMIERRRKDPSAPAGVFMEIIESKAAEPPQEAQSQNADGEQPNDTST